MNQFSRQRGMNVPSLSPDVNTPLADTPMPFGARSPVAIASMLLPSLATFRIVLARCSSAATSHLARP